MIIVDSSSTSDTQVWLLFGWVAADEWTGNKLITLDWFQEKNIIRNLILRIEKIIVTNVIRALRFILDLIFLGTVLYLWYQCDDTLGVLSVSVLVILPAERAVPHCLLDLSKAFKHSRKSPINMQWNLSVKTTLGTTKNVRSFNRWCLCTDSVEKNMESVSLDI